MKLALLVATCISLLLSCQKSSDSKLDSFLRRASSELWLVPQQAQPSEQSNISQNPNDTRLPNPNDIFANGPFNFGHSEYTIFENGQITTNGDAEFRIPFTGNSVDIPFAKRYNTTFKNVFSKNYRNISFGTDFQQVGRLGVKVHRVEQRFVPVAGQAEPKQFSVAVVSSVINRSSKNKSWTDALYGAARVDVLVDVSNEFICILEARVYGGHSFFDSNRPQSGYSPIHSNEYAEKEKFHSGINFMVSNVWPYPTKAPEQLKECAFTKALKNAGQDPVGVFAEIGGFLPAAPVLNDSFTNFQNTNFGPNQP